MHEGLCSLPEFTRLLALALLNWADDEGYFMANPAILRGSLFPFLDDSKKIPRSLRELSSVGWIDLGKDAQGRDVGRVCNFSKHQRVDKPKPSEIKASSVFQDASKNDLGCVQGGMERNGREEEQGTGKGMDTSAPAPPPLSKCFEKFWRLYPRKEAKADAVKAWKKVKPSDVEAIHAAVPIHAQSVGWQKEGGRFIPLPASWLNSRRWEDELNIAIHSDVVPAQSNYEDPPFLTDDGAIFHKP